MVPLLLTLGLLGCLTDERAQNNSPKTSPGVIGDIADDTGGEDTGAAGDTDALPTGGEDTDSTGDTDGTGGGGTTDGGTTDGGTTDGGTTDGGTTDGGTTDGGTTDDTTPVAPRAGDVVLTELMINPDFTFDADGEWIELLNVSGEWLDLAGCQLKDSDLDRCDISSSTGEALEMAPDQRMVICANADSALNGGVICDGTYTYLTTGDGCALANAGDEVILTDAKGVVIDRFLYDDVEYPDLVPMGASLGVDEEHASGVDNDDPLNWCAQYTLLPSGDYGTPGLVNDDCP